ncbi:hypothetical protein C5167_030492 [Papaver somniferum]|nr:hypothetical protein C5167_030492 [Papaver somniferum]
MVLCRDSSCQFLVFGSLRVLLVEEGLGAWSVLLMLCREDATTSDCLLTRISCPMVCTVGLVGCVFTHAELFVLLLEEVLVAIAHCRSAMPRMDILEVCARAKLNLTEREHGGQYKALASVSNYNRCLTHYANITSYSGAESQDHPACSDGLEDSEPSSFLVRMSLSAHSGDLASSHVDDRESLNGSCCDH